MQISSKMITSMSISLSAARARGRAAEKANELTSPHIRTQAQRLALYRLNPVL
jgi:hypothetical protein